MLSSKKNESKSITCFLASSYSLSLYTSRSPSLLICFEILSTSPSTLASTVCSGVEDSATFRNYVHSSTVRVKIPLGIAVKALQQREAIPVIDVLASIIASNGWLSPIESIYLLKTDGKLIKSPVTNTLVS